MAFPLTDEQKKIVDDRGGELLVSAAAGSGKTRVLVERLLDRVTREGADLDRFLVITYTKAAAAELRTRIAQELSARLAERPEDRHLRRQATLVYRAQISTIHAFCAQLLREEGRRLDLDPDFRLCDEGEAQVLMTQVLEDVLDRQYEGLTPEKPFAVLVDTLSAGRDDSRLAQIVLDVFGRIQSHPSPERWLAWQREVWTLEGVENAGKTPWGRLLLEDAARQGRDCAKRLEEALELAAEDELLAGNYGSSLQETLEGVRAFCAAAEREDWDGAFACLPIPFPAVGRKRKRGADLSPWQEARIAFVTQRVKALRDFVKERFGALAEWFDGDSQEQLAALRESRPAVQALMDLVGEFQRAYQAEKTRRSLLDFSDLEHLAVRLLLDPETGEPTRLAQEWSGRYVEVMVDEYQDTNQVQNAIFTAVSHGGRNLFQVGDVKQSIYRFRLADPTIFLKKYRQFPNGDEAREGEPRKRVLSRNFRSAPQVLLGCNDLFRNIMSVEFGELDYTDDQALAPPDGAMDALRPENALELNLLDLSFLGEQEEEEREDKNRLEARWAARRIQELLEAPKMVKDGDGERPLRPSDVMILLRSPGVVQPYYLQELSRAGIPWRADGGADFFSSTEGNVALALLQIVDNPRQDVPLLAVLRSPVYGFSGDKLALLRAESKDGDFYTAVARAAQRGDGDCRRFLDDLEELRFGAGDRTCRQLLWHIYEKTNLLGLFGAMPGGRERQDNLLSLYALAGELEESGCRSLFQFLLRLERLRAVGSKFSAAASSRKGEGVSLLSIHRAKGLECPVVLVCGLSRRLNREDFTRPVLFHPALGVGPKGLDRERMVEYPTLARRAVARQLEREMMAEELRLLYVAMTRAKEKLILSAALPQGIKVLERLAGEADSPVAPAALERQSNVGAWVLLHALTRPEAAGLREQLGVPEPEPQALGPAWDVRWMDGERLPLDQPEQAEGRFAGLDASDEVQAGEVEALLETLTWRYPHEAATAAPSKWTATQLKGRLLDQEVAEESGAGGLQAARPEPVQRPDFVIREKGLTSAERGTALHLAMQYLPLEGEHTPEAVGAALDRLAEQGFLTPLQREAVDPAVPAAFFASELGQKLLAAQEVRREFKFSILTPASDYGPGLEGEEVLLQGVIDCWFAWEDGLAVVDFKSDRIRPGQEPEQAERYRPQLESYSRALERITGRKVLRRSLWFFATGTAWEL